MEKITKKTSIPNFAEDSSLLLDALANAGGLEGLVEVGEQLFGNPLIIADQSWTVLAMTGVNIPDDVSWNEFRNEGTLSLNSVSLNIRHKLTERIETSAEPFFWQEPDMRHRRLIGKIIASGKAVATASVVEFGRDFCDGDIARMQLFTRAVSAELQKSRYQQYTRGLLYEDFITNILDGKLTGAERIGEKQRLFKLPLTEGLRVFAVDALGFDEHNLSLSRIRDGLDGILSLGVSLIYNDRIIVVKAYGNDSPVAEERYGNDRTALATFAGKYSLHCGVSRCVEGLTQLPAAHEQAVNALRVGMRIRRDEPVYDYDRYAVYLIAEICAEHGDLSVLSHAGFTRLISYDRNHDTNFANSLRAWFAHARSITDAAAALHMHRNSLIYHLKRAGEIMNVDLADGATLFHLELSLKFQEYAQ